MTETLEALLTDFGLERATRFEPLSGGCINRNYRLTRPGGDRCFLKTHPQPPAGFFEAEAAGLQALGTTGALRVPALLAVSPRGLLLEYLEPERPDGRFWRRFGAALAQLHRHPVDGFGFERDTYCGLTPQPNPPDADGHRFFAEHRLGYQAALAARRGLLPAGLYGRVEALIARLPELVPPQPPALIHGDLWSGNQLCHRGQPVLIDPAAHRGWAEAELAMTRLFGGFPAAFYDAYLAVNPLLPGWQERLALYNLYHLLNHLNLFGGGYLEPVRDLLEHYR